MIRILSVFILAGLLAACASQGDVIENDSSDAFIKHAGDPVSQIRYIRIRGWQPVGRDKFMIDFGAREQYLIEVSHECHGRMYGSASLGIVNYQPRVIDRTDRIVIDDLHRCRIMEMWPVDYQAVREELATVDDDLTKRQVAVSRAE